MKTPNHLELQHLAAGYDPVKAHEYYIRTRKLKGRKSAGNQLVPTKGPPKGKDPRTGKTKEQISKDARTKQRKELGERIKALGDKLKKLKARILELELEEASENRKSKAKSERAAKEAAKPDSAAEKAEKARDAEKYRDKNQQKLQSKSNDSSSSGSGSSSKSPAKVSDSIDDLKALATRVEGKLAVAKQKLAAL